MIWYNLAKNVIMKKGVVEQTWKENKDWKEESSLCGFL